MRCLFLFDSSDLMENSDATSNRRQNESDLYNNDPLWLQNSDHPGAQLVGVKLTGLNFQKWSRSVKIALRTKGKLGFIDGSCARPSQDTSKLEQWIKCDSMVVSWLLNSMVPDLSEAFLYVNTAHELWDELTERFGESNGPLLYQLEKEISDLYQGSDIVAVYYTKLKRLWDEISDMFDVPVCTCLETCPSILKTQASDQRKKLMQFLMYLNDEYEAIREQILLIDPLPTVNKAYSTIQRVERQRQVTHTTMVSREVAACTNRASLGEIGELETVNALVAKGKVRKDLRKSKVPKFCDHCQKSSHEKDQCFKLIGYPEWYDDLKGRKKVGRPRLAANVTSSSDGQETPLEDDFGTTKPQFDTHFLQALAQEMVKFTKGKSVNFDAKEGVFANFAGKNNFTGLSSICCGVRHFGQVDTWIVDTGASDHMSHNLTLFDKLELLEQSVYVTLLDGSVNNVTLGGNVWLDDNIFLRKVLYVPEFKFNLLSVTKFLTDQNLCIHVHPTQCICQDPTTSNIVAVAHDHNGLYILGASGSRSNRGQELSRDRKDTLERQAAVPGCFTAINKTCKQLSLEVLHARLGHTSLSKMRHIPDCKAVLSNNFFCETCILAKTHRLPFDRSTIAT